MAKETQYVFNEVAPGGPGIVPPKDESFLDQAAETTGKVTNVIQAIDRALNPQNYPQQTYQPTQQQQKAGFGWGKILLLTAAAGGAIYGGKQILDNQKKKSK